MTYQFDAVVDRSGNHSAKYDERKKKFGTEDVIPLWIADMDFKTAQPLSDAASKSFTVTGYILNVILIDSVTKEQVIGDVSFENATASANGKVTVTLAAAPSNPILVIITSIAL